MTLTFDEPALVLRLSRLSARGLVAFASGCAARLAPAYEVLQRALRGPAPDLVAKSLEHLWNFASHGTQSDWASMADRLIDLIPDEDSGPSFAHAVIDDALAATAYAARAAREHHPQDAAWSARRLYDAVDRFAMRRLGATSLTVAIEAQLLRNEFVQAELKRQARDLLILESATSDTVAAAIDEVRSAAAAVSALPLDYVAEWMAARD